MASLSVVLSDPNKVFKHLRRHGVNLDLVYELAGPGQVQTVIEIVRGWAGLPYGTPGGRMRVLSDNLDNAGVEDTDRRAAVWRAAKYIEKILKGGTQ